MFSGAISFTVHWEPPLYLNGALERYDVCVGETELEEKEECDVLALLNVPVNMLSTPDMPFLEVILRIIIPGRPDLALQVDIILRLVFYLIFLCRFEL